MQQESPRDAAMSRDMARHVTRRYRRILFGLSGALLLIGCAHGFSSGSATVFPRYGALVTILTLWHAYAQYQYMKMFELQVIPVAIAFASEIGKPERSGLLPHFMAQIQRNFVLDHLSVATTGTLVWGFGDLLPY
jgi:hypothetical protein